MSLLLAARSTSWRDECKSVRNIFARVGSIEIGGEEPRLRT